MDEKEFKIRYSRQISVEDFGIDAQRKLRNSKVAVIGCGALGSMCSMQLAGAGVGTIKIIDYDTIDISNLQRQFFFKTIEAGKSKVKTLAERISKLNPHVNIEVSETFFNSDNGPKLLEDADFVIDGSDNPSTKYLTEQICDKLKTPCCLAGVSMWKGQAMTIYNGSAKFSEIVPQAENDGFTPCSIGGVMGPAAAVAASIQAAEAIKHITGAGQNLVNCLMIFDIKNNKFTTIPL